LINQSLQKILKLFAEKETLHLQQYQNFICKHIKCSIPSVSITIKFQISHNKNGKSSAILYILQCLHRSAVKILAMFTSISCSKFVDIWRHQKFLYRHCILGFHPTFSRFTAGKRVGITTPIQSSRL